MTSRLTAWFRTICGDRDGAVLPLFAIMLIPMLGMTAAAVDHALWLERKARLQGAADAAALAGARELKIGAGAASALSVASAVANGQTPPGTVAEVAMAEAGTGVRVQLSLQADPILSALMSADSTRIAVSATAVAGDPAPMCMLALGADHPWGIRTVGSAQLLADKCALWSNSAGHESFRSFPATRVHAEGICAVGQINARGDVRPDPKWGCDPQPDPLAAWEPPATNGACRTRDDGTTVDGVLRLPPGVYCGGLRLETGQVVLEPGIFVMRDGPLSLRGNVTVRGDGVGIFMHGHDARLDFAGTGGLRLTAPLEGDMAGIVIAGPRALPPGTEDSSVGPDPALGGDSVVTGNFSLWFEGIIYLPAQTLTFWGNSDSDGVPPLSQIIADRIEVGGNGDLRLYGDLDAASVPVRMGSRGSVRLLR